MSSTDCSMGERADLKPTTLWIIISVMTLRSCYCDSYKTEYLRNQDVDQCRSELMSSALLADDQFNATSYLDNKNIFHPKMARLLDIHSQSSPNDGRAWCPANAVHKDLSEWIEVDFRRMVFLRALYTMGRGDGNFKKFTPEIVIQYQRSDTGPWFTYRDIVNASMISINTDSRTKLRTELQTIVAKKIRIYPLDSRTGPKMVCLKIAFLGCYFSDEILSYTAPRGDQGYFRDQFVDFHDNSYDGKAPETLSGGLGILTNNIVYINTFGADQFTYKDLNGVVTGWHCGKTRGKNPITITFHYEHERIFSQLSLFYVQRESEKISMSSPLTVSVGYYNHTHRFLQNTTIIDLNTVTISNHRITIPINQHRGTVCTLSIMCGDDNWIMLSEVEIKSVRSSGTSQRDDGNGVTRYVNQGTTGRYETSPRSGYSASDSPWRSRDVPLLVTVTLAVILLMIIFICVAFVIYKMRKSRKTKLKKKLELVAKCSDRNMCDHTGRTVFTIQSKHPSVSSIARPMYYSESKPGGNNTYAGSQLSDGVYASWPNTDEDIDVPNIDHEEEKCLLGTDTIDNKSGGNKDYAVYQPGVNFSGGSGSDYYHSSRPSSTLVPASHPGTITDKMPLSVANLKIVSTYDQPKSSPIVTYRNSTNVISYQHLINYRGICGDVDLRYQSMMPSRPDYQGLDSNIKVVSTTSILFVQPWIRGQFGCIDLVTVALHNNDTGRYFMKKLGPEAPVTVKSKFIHDLKILSSLNISTVARLAAIVVDGDIQQNNVEEMIRCARFCLLIDHNAGYNLKDFLRNIYYPTQTQNYKTSSLSSQTQISISAMLLIVTQISGALRHLEELGLTHRDVGCRNCIIDSRRQVKLYPGGYVTTQPFEDYCSIELQNHLINFPLRWLAPESIGKGVFTSKSDVWSFGVTMWEVFTLCSLMPYPSLANEALLELMTDREQSPRLPCPQNCPREMYDLMSQCWCWDESIRPTFVDINIFLLIKTTGSPNQTHLILPAPPPLPLAEDSF